jgi:hypothetical protein
MFLTNDLRWDGFGAQYQSIIWSILFAECNNDTFLYSDIERMLNHEEDEKSFIEKAVSLMNLKGKYTNVTDVGPQVIYALKWPYFYKQVEKNMEFYHSSSSFKKIQDLYFSNKQTPFDDKHLHVAVHIRRPVSIDVRINGADTPNDYYFKCMNGIRNDFSQSEKPLQFHIYSQGKESDFDVFKEFNPVFHLDETTFPSFIGMTFADILVTSASSYSYTAALLSKGMVLYLPFWHPPRAHWKILFSA